MSQAKSERFERGVSRRQMMAGVGAATGAATLGVAWPAGATPVDAVPRVAAAAVPRAAAPLTAGLVHLLLDASAFDAKVTTTAHFTDDASGAGIGVPPGGNLVAPLPLAVGAVIHELEVTYLAPLAASSVTIKKRPFAGNGVVDVKAVPLPAGGGRQTASTTVNEVADGTATYFLEMPITSPGQSIVGARVGIIPAPAAFIAAAGRILDTRTTGGKFAPGEERTVALGVPGAARAAVINLTITDTEGNGGFASVFPNGIPWPGTSSINWFGPNQNLANSVTTAVDATGAIKIHVGANRTHVVVDLAGYIL